MCGNNIRKRDFMIPITDLQKTWNMIVKIKKTTISPTDAIDIMVKRIGKHKTIEALSVVARKKLHDGRIYGNERLYTNGYPVSASKLNERLTGIDDIHPAHIHQLIRAFMNKYNIKVGA